MIRMRKYLPAILLILGFDAQAQLKFCNVTKDDVSLALNWKKDGAWVNDGWWTVKSGQCIKPTGQADKLTNRYYYYYARRRDGSEWGGGDGAATGCIVPSKNFETINENCPPDSQFVKYRQIDTGESRTYTVRITHTNEPFTPESPSDLALACELLNKNLEKPRLRSETIVLGSYTDIFTPPQTKTECTNIYDTGVPDPGTCRTECVQEWRTDFPKASGCMRWETRCSNVKACNTWKTEKKTMECDLVFRIKLPNYVERPVSDFIDSSYGIAEGMRDYAKSNLPLQCAPASGMQDSDVNKQVATEIANRIKERVHQTIEREARKWLQETAIETIAASIPSGGAGGGAIMSTKLAQFVVRTHNALKPIIKVANETKEYAEDLGFSTSCGWSDWHRF